jgi:drug/metabolite transporter (DMT)-like permease
VNPIIAVLLGWLLAGEALNSRVILAGVVTLTAVFLISKGTGEKRSAMTSQVDEAA